MVHLMSDTHDILVMSFESLGLFSSFSFDSFL